MPTAFKTDKVQDLLDKENIEVVFQVDTNVLMDYPEFKDWRTSLNGRVLFIITDMSIIELEHIKSRRGSKPESADKASRASRSLRELFDKGRIHEGINISGIGWFVSIRGPKQSALADELIELSSIAEAFRLTDVKEMLLTEQLHQDFPNLSLYFLSGDVNLCNMMSAHELPVKLLGGFPIELSSDEIAGAHIKGGLNWEKEIESITKQMARDSVEVKLLLRARRTMPRDYLKLDLEWPDSHITLAEGSGSVNGLAFEWSLPFSSWEYPFCRVGETEESRPSPSFWMENASLTFASDQSGLGQRIIDQIASRIAECAYPFAGDSGLPCLQDTVSVMKYFFYTQYLTSELDESLEVDFRTAYDKSRSFAYFCVADVLYPIACGEGGGEEVEWDILVHLFRILGQAWEVGEWKKIVVDTRVERG